MSWLKNNWFFLLAGAGLLAFLIFDQPQPVQTIQPEEEIPMVATEQPVASAEPMEKEPAGVIKVDIKGEVKNPGIYEMKEGKRVDDLIQTAGGLTNKADSLQVNLAQKLMDEMVIHVPASGETIETPPVSTAGSSQAGTKVHLNSATLEEIETLNGIGATKAQAILSYREENGPFSQPEDILNVSGIGEKTLENIMDSIQIP